MIFIGRFYHALEQKNRISIPVSFRSKLGEKVILTAGLDGCLFLLDESHWQSLINQVETSPLTQKKSRDWSRYLANNAVEIDFDSQGRLLIPEDMKEAAHLTKEVVVVGSVDRVELWDRSIYHKYLDDLTNRIETVTESIETKPNA